MLKVEQQIRDAQVELKAILVSRSNAEQKAKGARQAYETAVKLHETTVEQLQRDSKDVRVQLERVISEERTVSQVGGILVFTTLDLIQLPVLNFCIAASNVQNTGDKSKCTITHTRQTPKQDADKGICR